MADVLLKDETISARTVVRASPQAVYAVFSDVTRIPEWSPEVATVTWTDETHFRSSCRRRLGRWSSDARVVSNVPDSEFSFIVHIKALGGDWTQWTYRVEPGERPGECVLSEEVRMCQDLPRSVKLFELLCLWVKDRRGDLQRNLAASVAGVKAIAEAS